MDEQGDEQVTLQMLLNPALMRELVAALPVAGRRRHIDGILVMSAKPQRRTPNVQCRFCRSWFYASPSKIAVNKGKYCSIDCWQRSRADAA